MTVLDFLKTYSSSQDNPHLIEPKEYNLLSLLLSERKAQWFML